MKGLFKNVLHNKEYILKNRLDAALLVSIGCIIVGHIVPWGTPVRNLMFSFQMPLLFILTGFRMGKVNSRHEFLKQLMANIQYLMIPYVMFHVADSFLGVMLHEEMVDVSLWLEKLLWASGVEYKGHPLIGILWIINVLFWSKTIFSAIQLLIPKRFQGMCCGAAALVGYILGRQGVWLILSLDVALVVVFYLYVGSQLQKVLDSIRKHHLLILAALGVWLLPWSRGLYIEFAPRHYPWFLLVLAQSLCGSLCVIVLSRKIEKYFRLPGTRYGIEKYAIVALGLHHMAGRFGWLWGYGTFYDCIYNLTFIFLLTGLIALAKRWLEQSEQRWEQVFLAVFALYVIRLFCDTTVIVLPWPRYFDFSLRVVAVVMVWIRLNGQIWKSGWRIFLLVGTGAAFALSCFSNGYLFLFDLAVLAVGAKDIPYKKILKIYFWCGITILSLAIAASLTGAVRDLVYKKNGIYRHSFGICYPTDFAAHCVYLILTGFVIFDKIPLLVSAGFMLLFFLFQYFYCVTECSEIVMLLSVFGVAYVGIASRIKDRKSVLGRIVFLIDQCLTVFMVVCAGVIIWLSLRYHEENELLKKIDVIISSRLRLAREAFTTYGIKLFGTPFDMIGGGSETVWRQDYNFVDSAFCLILIRYGLAVLCAVLMIYFIVERKALRAGNRKLMVAFALISIHSMIEHHLLELAYNPFILLAFSNMDLAEGWKKETIREERAKGRAETVKEKQGWQQILHRKKNRIGYGLCGILLIFMAPGILQYGKTLVTLLGLYEPWRHRYVILALILVAGAAAGLVKGIVDIFILCLEQKMEKKEQKTESNEHKTGGQEQKTEQNSEGAGRRTAIGWKGYLVAGCGACLILVVGVSEYVIGKRAGLYEESLAVGGKAFSALREGGLEDGRFYVDDIPELYRRRFGGISGRVLSADSAGAGSDSNTVVIARKDRDIKRLMEAGFWFGELSDREGIYTDSERAVEVLKENGIDMKDYYSVRKEIDLPGLAEHNGLSVTEAGGLLVEGSEKSLIYGSYDVLYKGLLRVEYRIRLLDTSILEGEVARVRLAYEWGKHVVKEQGLTRSDFDENGYCTAVMEERIPDAEGVECLLFANGDTRIEIESISYRKVGR